MSKFVKKPWGGESWLACSPDFPYVMKKIFTKKGNRSSLQVHRKKQESNYVISGHGIVYKSIPVDVDGIDKNILPEMQKIYVGPESIFHVLPGEIHRVVALDDMLTIEVSTPEVDDVIRLQDDTGRGNGRIESEHK